MTLQTRLMGTLGVATAIVSALSACNSVDGDNHQCEVATWAHFSKAAVSYTFDDNLDNQFTIALPMLEKYGYRGTIYPVIKWVKDWNVIKAAAANGHEIGSHTVSHYALASLTPDTLEYELAYSKDFTEKALAPYHVVSIAYPYCNVPDTNAVASHYASARICDNRIENPTPNSWTHISSFGLGSESHTYFAADSIIAVFDKARKVNGWCSLLIHEVGEGNGYSPITPEYLDSTLAYLNNNADDFWVAPFAEVTKYILERDDIKIRLLSMSDNAITISLASTLDSEIYNTPLDIRRQLPQGWDNATASQKVGDNVTAIDACVNDGYVYFKASPVSSTVIISKN